MAKSTTTKGPKRPPKAAYGNNQKTRPVAVVKPAKGMK
jgi:hypothetical protein